MAWVRERLAPDWGCPGPSADLARALEAGTGAPGDLAHLLVAVVRAWGVPARYATGYCGLVPPADAGGGGQSQSQGADAAQERRPDDQPSVAGPGLHAWAEVLVPGAGWRGFDPSLNLVAAERHLAAAVGRDHLDTVPQRESHPDLAGESQREVRATVEQQPR
jgi:transglutaminase-like putative cysteine protease